MSSNVHSPTPARIRAALTGSAVLLTSLTIACGGTTTGDGTIPGGGGSDDPGGTLPAAPLVLAGVPDVRQATDYSCGPSSLVAVLGYYGVAATEPQLVDEAHVDPESGASLAQLINLASARGLIATSVAQASIDELAVEVNAGRPVIILNQSWRVDPSIPYRTDWDDGHYLTVIGIDASNVYLEDSVFEGARGYLPRAEFTTRWHGWTDDDVQTSGQALYLRGGPDRPGPQPDDSDTFQLVE